MAVSRNDQAPDLEPTIADPPGADSDQFETIERLDKFLKAAAKQLDQRSARMLVSAYYLIQKMRVRLENQLKTSNKPDAVLTWFFNNTKTLENDCKRALHTFAKEWKIGNWLLSLLGIGPVLSAGLLAHLDIRDCRTASRFWRFAGLDPTQEWKEGEKRPWNAQLKTLCYKIACSFIKQKHRSADFYGVLFDRRYEQEWQRNLSAGNTNQCQEILANKGAPGRKTLAYKWLAGQVSQEDARKLCASREWLTVKQSESGGIAMLPPAHILSRGMRWVEKLFLSHVHHAMWEDYYKTPPPVPFIIAKEPGRHTQYIPPPNWPFDGPGRCLTELLVYERKQK